MGNVAYLPSILRAMAKNYAGGHRWDHLDSEAVTKAADRIADLEVELAHLKSDLHDTKMNQHERDELRAENAKLRELLERRVLDGWKLVPVEPTQDIRDAIDLLCDDHRAFDDSDAFWHYLLDSAPSAPKADDPVKVKLLEALIDLESDISERFDMTDPSTNPGIRFAVESARAAIAAARQEGKKV